MAAVTSCESQVARGRKRGGEREGERKLLCVVLGYISNRISISAHNCLPFAIDATLKLFSNWLACIFCGSILSLVQILFSFVSNSLSYISIITSMTIENRAL